MSKPPQWNNLPKHWIAWIEKFSEGRADKSGKPVYLECSDFNGVVDLKFEDGSSMHLEHALFATDEDRQEIAVFTEHMGYHVYSMDEVVWNYKRYER